jgi:hypothetical protein
MRGHRQANCYKQMADWVLIIEIAGEVTWVDRGSTV